MHNNVELIGIGTLLDAAVQAFVLHQSFDNTELPDPEEIESGRNVGSGYRKLRPEARP